MSYSYKYALENIAAEELDRFEKGLEEYAFLVRRFEARGRICRRAWGALSALALSINLIHVWTDGKLGSSYEELAARIKEVEKQATTEETE